MPRIGNMQECKIYKIVSMNNPELVYYGHTCQTLARRFATHKSNHNKTTSKQIIDKGDAIILLVEDYPCLNENEARAREGFYILNNPCVNKNVAGRTMKQYYADNYDKIMIDMKQYYADNRDKIINDMKQYNLIHKDQLKEYKKQYNDTHKEQKKEYDKQYRAKKKAQ
jgi:hypothetical protein